MNVLAEQTDGNTCDFDGNVFQEGDVVPFQTRCGTTSDFPCYCAPDLPKQVYCPYCGFALEDQSLLCLMEGESETFVDIDGVNQTCGCTLDGPNGDPAPDCREELGEVTPAQQQTGGEGCTIDLPDGTTREFNNGEALGDFLPNRCGAEAFPCFCDPSVVGGISCPYCRFPQAGGDLLCAIDGEVVDFVDLDGIVLECSCTIPADPNADPIVSCEGDENTQSSSNNNGNLPSRPTSPPNDQTDLCTLELDESGQIITFRRGESYGDYFQTRCGSTVDYPCYCNPDLYNQMECPYCGFVTATGDLVCAKDRETVTFDSGGGGEETCLCEIAQDDPAAEPIRTCGSGVSAPPTPTPPDVELSQECVLLDFLGNEETFQNGDSLGDLVEGICGDSDMWPAFCNTNLATATIVTRQSESQPRDISNGIEYPYCIYSDTLSGDPVCARNSEEITYTNRQGEDTQCSCLYLSPGLGGGAQSQCQPVNGSSGNGLSPTPSPNTGGPQDSPPPFQSPSNNGNSGAENVLRTWGFLSAMAGALGSYFMTQL